MPRHPRLFIRGATYHVYCRVARGEFVFDDDYEAVEFVETLREVRDLDGGSVLAWFLIGNHYHLVVKTRNVDLWRSSMARLQGRISRAHNRRHRYLGRLWQSRYRTRVVDTNMGATLRINALLLSHGQQAQQLSVPIGAYRCLSVPIGIGASIGARGNFLNFVRQAPP